MSSRNLNTIVRGLIAIVVVYVSYRLTGTAETSSKNWDAVLLIVVGYYFKDRPIEESGVEGISDARALLIETSTQFLIALVLTGFTVLAFWKTGETAISGAWVGAVVLAVGFYFKDAEPQDQANVPFAEKVLLPTRGLFRTLIALLVSLLTLFFVSPFYRGHEVDSLSNLSFPTVPIQWVGIVLIVVAFYFKERTRSSTGNAAEKQASPFE
jgi:uncharacterized membrane protein